MSVEEATGGRVHSIFFLEVRDELACECTSPGTVIHRVNKLVSAACQRLIENNPDHRWQILVTHALSASTGTTITEGGDIGTIPRQEEDRRGAIGAHAISGW